MKFIFLLSFTFLLSLTSLKAQFAASNFTLLSNINPETGVNGYGDKYSACWGWTQPLTNKEYAIACSKSGTYWVDVTNPASPTICAFKAGASSNGTWRETKTYQNYCYVVCDDASSTGLQIFDMSTLPATVTLVSQNTNLFKRGHACWVDGNKLYVSGVTYTTGSSSMDVYSLATPSAPVLLRRLDQDYPLIDYVHDEFVRNDTVYASCGWDGLYVFKYNSIANNFTQLGSLITYSGMGYNHATSWTPNGQTLIMTDEVPDGLPIKIVDVSNLANMSVLATTNQFTATTPHNPWVVNNKYCFLSSYQEGTQLYDISNPNAPVLAGYFDTYNQGGGNTGNWGADAYKGQWGLYPYFPSKNIFALDMSNGIFMLSTHLYSNPEINLLGNGNNILDGAIITNTSNNTNFGNVTVGSSNTKQFLIQNSGLGTLTITSINYSGANAGDFAVLGGPALPFTVAPSGSQSFSVQFTPGAANTRSATIILNNNDINESSYDFVLSGSGTLTPAGITNIKKQNFNITIFPNPAKNEVEFSIPLGLSNKEMEINIFDIEGKLVAEKSNLEMVKTTNINRKINVSELSNGLYYIFIITSDAKYLASKKLIINR